MAFKICSWQPDSTLDFDGVEAGQTKDLVATLFADPGNSENVIGTVSTAGSPFSIISGASYNIAPGGNHNVTIRFSPSNVQSYTQVNGLQAIGNQDNGTQSRSMTGWGGSQTFQIRIEDKKTKGGDLVKVTMTFDRTDGGLFAVDYEDGNDIGVRLLDAGEIDWSLDLNELWVMAGIWSIRLGDYGSEKYLADLFFQDGSTTGIAPAGVDRRPSVKLEIKHDTTGSYVTEFIGNVLDEGGVNRGNGLAENVVVLNISPKIDELNRTMLYKDGSALNPFSYTQNTYRNLQSLIEDIFELVDASVVVSFSHGWGYKAQYAANPYHYDVVFSEIYQYVNELYFDTAYGLETVGDVLRKLAVDWGAVTGMVHSQKAFFRSLFRTQPSNKFTPTHVFEDRWIYDLPVYKYVKIEGGNGKIGEEGNFTELAGEFLDRKALPNFYDWDPGSRYSHVIALHAGGEGPSGQVEIYGARDTDIDTTYRDSHNHQAKFWYHFRGNKDKSRVRLVRYHGLAHSIDKMMEYDGGNYLVLKMKKKIGDSITTVEGLKL